jgi:Family of unknown function (DUF6533)
MFFTLSAPGELATRQPRVELNIVSDKVILYYDYALTLSREIQFLWPPHNKQGWFTMACLLNRYLPLLGHLPLVISYLFPGKVSVRPLF